jgi:hypothetical protein
MWKARFGQAGKKRDRSKPQCGVSVKLQRRRQRRRAMCLESRVENANLEYSSIEMRIRSGEPAVAGTR